MSFQQPIPNPVRWQRASLGAPPDVGGHIQHSGVLAAGEVPVIDAAPHQVGHCYRIVVRWEVDGQVLLLTEQQQPGEEAVLGAWYWAAPIVTSVLSSVFI